MITQTSHWVICLDSASTDDGTLSELLHRVETLSKEHGLQLRAEQAPRLLALWERPRFVWSLQGAEPEAASIKILLTTMARWSDTSRLGLLHAVNPDQIAHPPQTMEREDLRLSTLDNTQQDWGWFPAGDQPALIHWS